MRRFWQFVSRFRFCCWCIGMPVIRHYSCPDCEGRFPWLHHPSDEPPPNFCPLCGSCVTVDPAFVPAAPHIGRSIGRTADQVYRQMEVASADAAASAAAFAGDSPADHAVMKISDMADYLRPGDTAAKMRDNPIAQMMSAGQGGFQGLGGLSGADFAAGVAQGAFPRRGEATRQSLVADHHQLARAMEGPRRR